MQSPSRNPLLLIAAVAAIVLGVAAGRFVARDTQDNRYEPTATVFRTGRPLPEFSLLDESGEVFSNADLTGAWTLVFFGFTHCPDVCPATLLTLARTTERLRDTGETPPRVVLVSVDPERDAPERLRDYVKYFDPAFRGVSGPGVFDLTGKLGVAHTRVEQEGGYTIDHTASVFIIDPDANWVALSSPPHTVGQLVTDYLWLRDQRQ